MSTGLKGFEEKKCKGFWISFYQWNLELDDKELAK